MKRCYLVFVFAALAVFCCLNQATADVLINEFMAKNNDTYPNGEGKYYDWIELYNDSTGSVDLTGWYLTDDNEDLPQWQFPAVILDPYEF
ncbi:MAG: lamin tail domain-containing protein, partial [Kiritimatiellia bacterium]|nr:lamin tail domain-containing protein [Kiritimatiellia bacterium]